jgi:hypothetical protein
MLWVLNLSDGDHSLLDIAERSGLGFAAIKDAAAALRDCGLLREKLAAQHDLAASFLGASGCPRQGTDTRRGSVAEYSGPVPAPPEA